MAIEKIASNLFSVTHECFSGHTNSLTNIQTIVVAKDRKEALKKYNRIAEKKKEMPFLWNQVDLSSVEQLILVE